MAFSTGHYSQRIKMYAFTKVTRDGDKAAMWDVG